MIKHARTFSPTQMWFSALGALIIFIVLAGLASGFFNPTDLAAWQNDWALALSCFHAGATHCGSLSKFPLAYLFNAMLVGHGTVLLALANLLALGLPLLCLGLLRGWRMSLGASGVYAVALLLSPLPAFYIYSGALEVQAGAVCGIYIGTLAVLLEDDGTTRRAGAAPWVLFLSGLLLPLFKDTIAVLLAASAAVAFAIGCLRKESRSRLPRWKAIRSFLLFGGLPVAIGLMLSSAYNVFKYGVPWSIAYVAEGKATSPSVERSAEFLLGSLLSPNGGVFVFWLLPIFLAVSGWRLLGLAPRGHAVWLAAIAALLSCVAFSCWWAPFGWDGWGNRLMVQPMLALLVAMLVCLRPNLERLRTLPPIWVSLLCLPVLGWSAYYVAVPYVAGRSEIIGASLWSGPACEDMRQGLRVQAPTMGLSFWKSDVYYRCARERMMYVPTMDPG
ncbi:hypothetical protein OCJ37_17455 [Xanthomonas sp. AM6]|uniref:hypothetical protein n=1 Tax=Xanthomonas sp. AM6 TaxID=2982531 RepID=UPI0021D95E3F|nr:hypothetical protein [Xanthomonas sp. AM6]UYB51733.1 hypothetical protein OCJ37_17455 [Xanthomonas sp. AM6]